MYRGDTQITTPVKGRHKPSTMQGEPFLRHTPTRDTVNGVTSPQRKSGRKYETFVMTGDMMIRTTSDHDDLDTDIRTPGKNKEVPVDHNVHSQEGSVSKKKKTEHSKSKIPKFNTSLPSPKTIPKNSSIPTAVNNNQNNSPVLSQKKSPKIAQKKVKQEIVQEFHTGLPVYTKQPAKESPKTLKKNVPQIGTTMESSSPLTSPKGKVKGSNIINTKHTSGIPTKMSKIPTKDSGQQERPINTVIKEPRENLEAQEDSELLGQISEASGERVTNSDLITGATPPVGVQESHGQNVVLNEEISNTSNKTLKEHFILSKEQLSSTEEKVMDSSSREERPHSVLPCHAVDDLFTAMKQPLHEQSLDHVITNNQDASDIGELVMHKRSPFDEYQRPVYHTCDAIPIQLDIPPDDICSEDERYSCSEEGFFDVENLPPPPEELLRDFEEEDKITEESMKQDIHIGGAFFMENTQLNNLYENRLCTSPYGNNTQHNPMSSLNNSEINTMINTQVSSIEGKNEACYPGSTVPLHIEKGLPRLESRETVFRGQEEICRSESIDVSHSISREGTKPGTAALIDNRVTSTDQSHTNVQNIGSSVINNLPEGNGVHYNAVTSIAAVSNRTVPVALQNGEQRTSFTSTQATPTVSDAVNGTFSHGTDPTFSNNSIHRASSTTVSSDPVADLFTSGAFTEDSNSTTSDQTVKDVCSSVYAVNKLPQDSLLSVTQKPRGVEAVSVSQCNINDRAQPAPVLLPSEDFSRALDKGHKELGQGNDIHEELLDHALESQIPMDTSFNVPTPPSQLAIASKDPNQLDYLSQVDCKPANTTTNTPLITPGKTQNEEPIETREESKGHNNNEAIGSQQELFPSGDECPNKRGMVTSFSGEGFAFKTLPNKTMRGEASARESPMLVRTSKSHENYLDNQEMTMINIDLGDDFASSVDALHYDQSSTSLDKYNGYSQELIEQSKSLDNSPERR